MTRIYFAGADCHWKFLMKHRIKSMMFSYLYHKGWIQKVLEDYKEMFFQLNKSGVSIFVDSGAHSIQVKGGGKSAKYELEEYMEEYIKFLKKYKDVIKTYVELDVEDVIGVEKVNEWYERMLSEGLNPLRVWHPERGLQNWKDETKKFDYIGIGKFTQLPLPVLKRMMEIAENNKCKVHGFGCTDPTLIQALPFYTTDSTSWLVGEKFGQIPVYSNGKLLFYNKRQVFDKFKKFNDLPYQIIRKFSIYQWKKFELHVNNRWKEAYFNKITEEDLIGKHKVL